jgi:CheY-like chemotaxis protein
VVEDEEDAREMMGELVELGGCSAPGCKRRRSLASAHVATPLPLIVLDLLMPVMSGVELLEALRQQPALASIPVLIATSAPHRAPAGTPILPKPVDVDVLWDWMRRSCRCALATPAPLERDTRP